MGVVVLLFACLLCTLTSTTTSSLIHAQDALSRHPHHQRITYEAESAHATSNIHILSDHVVMLAAHTSLPPTPLPQGQLVFTVFVAEDGVFPTTIRYRHSGGAEVTTSSIRLDMLINGHPHHLTLPRGEGEVESWSNHVVEVQMRKGLNTVVLRNLDTISISIDNISIMGAIIQSPSGATLPYVEMEAEAAYTNANVLGPDRTYRTLPSEASGRKAVQLSAQGHFVEFTLTSPANALVVRLSIPDSADGKGNDGFLGVYVNGAYTTNITVTSRYSWVYGGYPYSNNPSDGLPHHFYDDARALLGKSYPAGTKIRLAGLSALSYAIDLVDFYQAPNPYTMPSGYLSVTTYGADPSGVKDSTSAFQNAINAAQSQSKGLWIPQGIFLVNAKFGVNKITIRGAGPWYTVVKASAMAGVGFFGNGAPNPSQGVGLYDFAIFGATNRRDDSSVDSGIGGAYDSTSIIQNLWIEHTKVGIWVDGPFQGLHITGISIRNTFADGINLHKAVTNVVVEQSTIRNTGDDCLAMFSEAAANKGNVFKFNTAQIPLLANALAIYGGDSNSATDNYVSDSVTEGGGLQASNRFGAVPLSGTTSFARNTVVRCGAQNSYTSGRNGALWFWAENSAITGVINVTDTDIIDSSYSAITFWGLTTIDNAYFSNIRVNTAPFVVSVWGTSGTAYMEYVVAQNIAVKGICSCMDGKFIIKNGPGNTGWSSTQCTSDC